MRADERKRVMDTKSRLREKLAKKGGQKKICLVMIVKNESKNMNRILDSVKRYVDTVCVTDTGSTDDTVSVTERWGERNGIPTVVLSEPFKDFAHNRTLSVREAKRCFPEADYVLLSDADFVWVQEGEFDKVLLFEHKYLVEQYNNHIRYWNIRLLSTKIDWECVGLTHEFWRECRDQKETIRVARINTLKIDDREDGGCKNDKFERDERLLRSGLEDPDTTDELRTRYRFYLAQTLKDVGRYEESARYYRERIRDGGWAEEVYYSKFQAAFCEEQMAWKAKKEGDEEGFESHVREALDTYKKAYEYRRCRSESLLYMVRLLRSLGRLEEAFRWAKVGIEIPHPETDTLFIETACYAYMFHYEMSIVGYYAVGGRRYGKESLKKLLDDPRIPEWMRNNLVENAKHYN